jgi:hypothetical protein
LNVWLEQALAFLYTAPGGPADVACVALDWYQKQAIKIARRTGRYTVGIDSDFRRCAENQESQPVIAKNRPRGFGTKGLIAH